MTQPTPATPTSLNSDSSTSITSSDAALNSSTVNGRQYQVLHFLTNDGKETTEPVNIYEDDFGKYTTDGNGEKYSVINHNGKLYAKDPNSNAQYDDNDMVYMDGNLVTRKEYRASDPFRILDDITDVVFSAIAKIIRYLTRSAPSLVGNATTLVSSSSPTTNTQLITSSNKSPTPTTAPTPTPVTSTTTTGTDTTTTSATTPIATSSSSSTTTTHSSLSTTDVAPTNVAATNQTENENKRAELTKLREELTALLHETRALRGSNDNGDVDAAYKWGKDNNNMSQYTKHNTRLNELTGGQYNDKREPIGGLIGNTRKEIQRLEQSLASADTHNQ